MPEPTPPRPVRLRPPGGAVRDVTPHAGDRFEDERLHVVGQRRVHWAGGRVASCAVSVDPMDVLTVTGGRFFDSTIDDVNLHRFEATETDWRSVQIGGGRVIDFEASDGRWDRVELRGMRIGYLNLRATRIEDLTVQDCRIDTLDLSAASAQRVSVRGSQIDELVAQDAAVTDTDLRGAEMSAIIAISGLRGATLSPRQVVDAAELLAEALEIRVRSDRADTLRG